MKEKIKGNFKHKPKRLHIIILILQRKHPDEHTEYEEYKKLKKLKTDENRVIRRVTCRFSQKQFADNVTAFILDGQLALQTVEKPTFRKIFDSKVACNCA